jgi:OmpA family protein
MRSTLAVLLAFGFLAPETGAAQSGTAVAAPALGDSAPAAEAPAPKKKGGMFGKIKGLAKNKIVKTVAKAALCTAVPGGSMIAGAIDAAETKNVAGAATTAVTGGNSCMPGMGGMAGAVGGGKARVAAAGVGALGAGIPAGAMPGQPSMGMPGVGMSAEQVKQMQAQYGKMGMDAAQLRAMQQMMANMPGASPAGAGATPGSEPATGAPALSREKGRMLVRRLPWLAGSEARQQGGEPMFGMAMQEVAGAIRATSKRYKIEARVEEQGGKAPNRLLSEKRAAAVLVALTARGIPAERLTVAGGGADKDPRIIVSEGK